MAVFSNQATLSYNGISTNSNVAFGEILDAVTITKTAVEDSYTIGDRVTYVVSLRNTGNSPFIGLTVTDNLGSTTAPDGTTVYPLTYESGSVLYYVNGVLQGAPTVTEGPSLTVSGINIPALGNAEIVYQAVVNSFASPDVGAGITNTATVTGAGITGVISDSETVGSTTGANLTITKSITPSQVVDNDRVTYTFVIQNFGNEAVANATVSDTFNPILSALAVNYDGTAWTEGTEYTYNEATGLFTTNVGSITVPAATVIQNTNGEFVTTPGSVTLTVTGTI